MAKYEQIERKVILQACLTDSQKHEQGDSFYTTRQEGIQASTDENVGALWHMSFHHDILGYSTKHKEESGGQREENKLWSMDSVKEQRASIGENLHLTKIFSNLTHIKRSKQVNTQWGKNKTGVNSVTRTAALIRVQWNVKRESLREEAFRKRLPTVKQLHDMMPK